MTKPILPGHLKPANERTAKRVHDRRKVSVSYRGADDMEQRINALKENIADVEGEEFWLLDYDIPEPSRFLSEEEQAKRRFPNPSRLLWKCRMFRLQYSGFICRTSTLSHPAILKLFGRMDKEGITYDLIPFHPAAVEGIRSIAVRKLDVYIRERHGKLIETIADADKALADVLNLPEPTHNEVLSASKAYANSVKGRMKKACEDLDACIKCAEEFDATEDVNELLKAFRLALRVKQLAFNEMAEWNRIKPVAVVSEEPDAPVEVEEELVEA